MASKKDQFYFDNLTAAATASLRAAEYLEAFIRAGDLSGIEASMAELHAIEHQGDECKHKMTGALAHAFITPIDREDLALISANIDEVTDKIEEVLQLFYIDRISEILPEASGFAALLTTCCSLMRELAEQLPHFKKPAALHELIVKLNNAEEECDAYYLRAAHAVRSHTSDADSILSWRRIYDCMESCADACEHVGDCIETVIMKNS